MYWSSAYFRDKNGRILITLAGGDDVVLQNDDGTFTGTGLEPDQFPTKENIQAIVDDLEERLANIRKYADAWFRENPVPSEKTAAVLDISSKENWVEIPCLVKWPDMGKARVKFRVPYDGDIFLDAGCLAFRLWRAKDGSVSFYEIPEEHFVETLDSSCYLGRTLVTLFPEWFELEN